MQHIDDIPDWLTDDVHVQCVLQELTNYARELEIKTTESTSALQVTRLVVTKKIINEVGFQALEEPRASIPTANLEGLDAQLSRITEYARKVKLDC